MIWEGISDLTTTEGNIKKFSLICNIFENKPIFKEDIIRIIKYDPIIHRTNKKVIERHLSIMTHLDLIKQDLNYYYLTSNGKILKELIKKEHFHNIKQLSQYELVFYFKLFFTGKTLPQLYLLLESLNNKDDLKIDQIIYNYYNSILMNHLKIWDTINITKRLNEYVKNGILKRAEKNRFDCMRKWIEQLKLIDHYDLSSIGNDVSKQLFILKHNTIEWKEYQKTLNNNIFYICKFYNKSKKYLEFNIDNHYLLFYNYFKESFTKFGNYNMGTMDYYYLENWPQIHLLLNDNIYFLEKCLDNVIKKLIDQKIIKSIIPGDYYKQKLVQINVNNF